jgi:hypothetical protein
MNEQPREFWIDIFKQRNYNYDAQITERVRNDMKKDGVLWWYCDNIMVFKRKVSH